jgi:predicted DsbA family dithiol-disulfide isomerase
VKVEIWSDIVCPWCYIGKRRFEAALAEFEHADAVEIEYRAFELDPTPGRDKTITEAQMLANKFGIAPAQAEQMLADVTRQAQAVGLRFDFDHAIGANTFLAHQLLAYADEHGLQAATKERLLQAHFEQGADVEDLETLIRLGSEVGLEPDEVRDVLSDNRYESTVRQQEQEAGALGIRGVPFFVIDRRFGISGAQSPETFTAALERAWRETSHAIV